MNRDHGTLIRTTADAENIVRTIERRTPVLDVSLAIVVVPPMAEKIAPEALAALRWLRCPATRVALMGGQASFRADLAGWLAGPRRTVVHSGPAHELRHVMTPYDEHERRDLAVRLVGDKPRLTGGARADASAVVDLGRPSSFDGASAHALDETAEIVRRAVVRAGAVMLAGARFSTRAEVALRLSGAGIRHVTFDPRGRDDESRRQA